MLTRSSLTLWPAAALVLASCSHEIAPSQVPLTNLPAAQQRSATSLDLGDPHFEGQGSELLLASVSYGQLVDLIHEDPSGRRTFLAADLVVPYHLTGDSPGWDLERSATTSRVKLVGRATTQGEILQSVAELDQDLEPMLQGELSTVPGDAVWVLRFSDLLDTSTLGDAVQTLVTSDAGVPVDVDARVLFDHHHGGRTPSGQWAPTRVLVDPAVAQQETLGTSLGANPSGVAGGIELRLPTVPAGAVEPLANLRGRALCAGTCPVDFASPNQHVRLASTAVVSMPADQRYSLGAAPQVLGTLDVDVVNSPIQDALDPTQFTLVNSVALDADCAYAPRVGDAFIQNELYLLEVVKASPPLNGETIERLTLRLLLGDANAYANEGPGTGFLITSFDPSADADRAQCFISILGGTAKALSTNPTIRAQFSSPLDLSNLDPYDGFVLGRSDLTQDPDLSGDERVPAELAPADILGFSIAWTPLTPLHHTQGASETYYMHFFGGDLGLMGEGGVPIAHLPRPIALQVDPSAASQTSGGHVTRFTQPDEFAPFDNSPEWGGNLVYQGSGELITPRPVTRFSAEVDAGQPIVANMTAFPFGSPGTLNRLGAKTQIVWRYADMGLQVQDKSLSDLDVEGLAWAPLGGQTVVDQYQEFEIALSHSTRQPDEIINPGTLLPMFPTSGLEQVYGGNVVGGQEVVHPRQLGYTINPGDLYVGDNGTSFQPYPLNQPVTGENTYTWRDTSIQERFGPDGGGVPLRQELVVNGMDPGATPFNPANEVQSIGLPLLMDFRCFADNGANGVNSFAIALAANTSKTPFFRAFSAGGIDSSGSTVVVDPDLEAQANGGFSVNSNPPGLPTPGQDNVMTYGAVDFVVRVSRAYSVWRPALSSDEPATLLASPTYEPAQVLSFGVSGSVEVAYRGVDSVAAQHPTIPGLRHPAVFDATTLDAYGDHYDDTAVLGGEVPNHAQARANLGIDFGQGSDMWQSSVDSVQGARWVQLRLTMIADAATGEVPHVTSVASAWSE